MDDQERAQLIRQGNREFNAGNVRVAARIFESAGYKDGLIRVGDHFYKKQQPLIAYGFYRKGGETKKIQSLQYSFALALKMWLMEDETPADEKNTGAVVNSSEKNPPPKSGVVAPQLGRDKYRKD